MIRDIKGRVRDNLFIIIIATISFFTIIFISHFIFPYYSNNHDEGVYIFQAKMLAKGNIYLENSAYSDFFDTWFFVNDGEKIYSRYTPVHSSVLAIFYFIFGDMIFAIGIISGLSLIFLYLIAKEIYDKNIAKIATIICLSSPLFLIISSTYLSYTSAFLFSLIFIYFFIKNLNNDNIKYGSIAGIALGILFFNRPYDAILVGIPFVIYLFYKAITEKKIRFKLYIIILSFLLIFLIVLLYNYVLTNDPFLFPFNKYEPLDTIGFGIKRVSAYSPIYLFTIDSAIEALKVSLYNLLFNWTLTGIFFIGFIYIILRRKLSMSRYEILLLALFISITTGNFIFWGSYNHLEWKNAFNIFGPVYYFNMLFPLSIISGKMIDYISTLINNTKPIVRLNIIPIILIVIILINVVLIYPKIELNYRYTEKNKKLYEPIVGKNISNAIIFLPCIYGPFMQHPLGFLINEPSFNGSIIYSKDLGHRNIQLMNKYENRKYYTYQYDGIYTESYSDNFSVQLTELNFDKNLFDQNLGTTCEGIKENIDELIFDDDDSIMLADLEILE